MGSIKSCRIHISSEFARIRFCLERPENIISCPVQIFRQVNLVPSGPAVLKINAIFHHLISTESCLRDRVTRGYKPICTCCIYLGIMRSQVFSKTLKVSTNRNRRTLAYYSNVTQSLMFFSVSSGERGGLQRTKPRRQNAQCTAV